MLSTHWTTTTDLDERDLNRLDLLARQAADILEHRQIVETLQRSEAKMRSIMETAVEGIITIDRQGNIESFNRAAEDIFGYDAAEVIGENVKVLMPSPYREEHDEYLRTYHETGEKNIIGTGREVVGRRKDGSTFPMDLAVSEVEVHDRILYTGIVRDISKRRELEKAVIDTSETVRREIAQDLHDVLSSDLAAVTMKTGYLKDRLEQQGVEEAEELEEILQMVRESANHARTLSHSLMPIALREESLAAGLANLCREEEDLSHLTCSFDGDRDEPLPTDDGIAMHLYRIAREATVNARRHAQANVVKMSLRRRDAALVLTVWDDGVGIPKADEREAGLGLRTMRYRADVVGASLTIEPGEEGGTVVRCALPLSAAKVD